MIPAHTPATLTARIRRQPASLGSSHYYLEPGQAVRVLSATDTDARCYCGQPEDSRISEDYFTVPLSSLQVDQPPLDYPPKPENATHFQRHYGYEPATVIKWEWSTTFGRWGALVRFADGAEIYTYPSPAERIRSIAAGIDGTATADSLLALASEIDQTPLILWGRKEDHAGGEWIKLADYSPAAVKSRIKEGWETAVRKRGESPKAAPHPPTVPALRIGAPVRVKCHERAGERGIIVSEDRGLFVVRFPDMSTGRFTADSLTVLE